MKPEVLDRAKRVDSVLSLPIGYCKETTSRNVTNLVFLEKFVKDLRGTGIEITKSEGTHRRIG
jgi:hypothetical protein